MVIKYEEIVPWGRNYSEYIKMFSLTEEELKKNIVGCGDGPASFNYEATLKGYKVISVDPIYIFTRDELEKRIADTYDIVIEQTSKNSDKFVWKNFKDISELGKVRMEAMKLFLNDYFKGIEEKRYIAGELPKLKFDENEFDISLCSHFLFLYSDNMSFEFHIEAIKEMLRISKEVRIFPILDNNLGISRHYNSVLEYFRNENILIEEVEVDYEFQKNGNRMLKLKKRI